MHRAPAPPNPPPDRHPTPAQPRRRPPHRPDPARLRPPPRRHLRPPRQRPRLPPYRQGLRHQQNRHHPRPHPPRHPARRRARAPAAPPRRPRPRPHAAAVPPPRRRTQPRRHPRRPPARANPTQPAWHDDWLDGVADPLDFRHLPTPALHAEAPPPDRTFHRRHLRRPRHRAAALPRPVLECAVLCHPALRRQPGDLRPAALAPRGEFRARAGSAPDAGPDLAAGGDRPRQGRHPQGARVPDRRGPARAALHPAQTRTPAAHRQSACPGGVTPPVPPAAWRAPDTPPAATGPP